MRSLPGHMTPSAPCLQRPALRCELLLSKCPLPLGSADVDRGMLPRFSVLPAGVVPDLAIGPTGRALARLQCHQPSQHLREVNLQTGRKSIALALSFFDPM